MYETIEPILTFLSSKQAVIIGATATIVEVVITIVNAYRRCKDAEKKLATLTVVPAEVAKDHPETNFYSFLVWSLNPVNLFRKTNAY